MVEDIGAEPTAFGKAKAILLKKFSLVQAGTATRVQALDKAHGEDPMARALRSPQRRIIWA